MKVTSVTRNTYDTSSIKNNVSVQPPRMSNQPARDSVSFSGLKNGLSGMFESMGSNFFVQFLVVDTLSMIIPRVLVGLGRDKEKTGKLNIKAGAEEAGREITSGPSMGLIPMGILAAVTHFAPASHMQAETLTAVTDKMDEAIAKIADSKDFTSKESLNKKLADELFEGVFGDENKFDFDTKARADFKSKFAKLLDEGSGLKSGMFGSKEYKAKAGEFENLVAEIYNSNKKAKPLDTKTLKINFRESKKNEFVMKDGKNVIGQTEVGVKDFFKDFQNYSKDVVEKVSKKGFAQSALESGKNEASEFVKVMKKNRAITKHATVIGAFFAVGIFLINLPKLYQQSGLSPAQESAKRAQAEAASPGGTNENK